MCKQQITSNEQQITLRPLFDMRKNPLRQEPRFQQTAVVRAKSELSLISSLMASGRMVAREIAGSETVAEESEISELLDVEQAIYNIDEEEDSLYE